MGCGAIGLGVVQAIKIVQPDCEVWVLERVPIRISIPKSWARTTCSPAKFTKPRPKPPAAAPSTPAWGGNRYFFGGFDRVYDCVGGDWSNHTAVRLLRARGTLVKIGPPHARRHLR